MYAPTKGRDVKYCKRCYIIIITNQTHAIHHTKISLTLFINTKCKSPKKNKNSTNYVPSLTFTEPTFKVVHFLYDYQLTYQFMFFKCLNLNFDYSAVIMYTITHTYTLLTRRVRVPKFNNSGMYLYPCVC